MSERPWSEDEEQYRVRSGLPPWEDQAPIDLPTRLRAAAEVADRGSWSAYANLLRSLATWLEQEADPDVVEAIEQALDGRGSDATGGRV